MSYFIHQVIEKDRRNFKLIYLLSLSYSTYCVLEHVDISYLYSTIQLTLMRSYGLTDHTVCPCPEQYSFTPERKYYHTKLDSICNVDHRSIPGYTG